MINFSDSLKEYKSVVEAYKKLSTDTLYSVGVNYFFS